MKTFKRSRDAIRYATKRSYEKLSDCKFTGKFVKGHWTGGVHATDVVGRTVFDTVKRRKGIAISQLSTNGEHGPRLRGLDTVLVRFGTREEYISLGPDQKRYRVLKEA